MLWGCSGDALEMVWECWNGWRSVIEGKVARPRPDCLQLDTGERFDGWSGREGEGRVDSGLGVSIRRVYI